MSMYASQSSMSPYECFGIYLVLQFVFFLSAFFMNKSMEPGEITEYTSLKDGLDKKFDSDDENSSLNKQEKA